MLSREDYLEKFKELPEIVQDHLLDENIADLNDGVSLLNDIGPNERPTLHQLVNELVVREIPVEALVDEVKKRFGFSEEKSKELAVDIAGYRLLPLNGFLGDVAGFITANGGDVEDYPPERIKVEARTTDAAVDDVEHTITVGQLPHRLKSRFEDAVRSYFKSVRSESQLVDILTRAEKIGGVGLDMKSAQEVVRRAQEEKKSVIIKDETPPAAPRKTPASEDVPSPPQKTKDTFATVLPEDEEEIERVRENLPEGELKKSSDTDAKIKASVDEIYKAAGVSLDSSESLTARFRKIIENRLRDIRDELETLEVLVQPKELGGMSLSQDDARRVLTLIESKLRSVHDKHTEEIKEKKAQWVAKESRRAIERIKAEKAAETAERNAAFRRATEHSKKLSVPAPAAPKTPPPNLPIPSGNAAAPVAPVLTKPVRKIVPASPEVKSATAVVSAPSRAKQPPSSPVRPAQPPPPSAPTKKPVMRDVKALAPRATGPVEALRTTSVEDFRHLSKDPKEAILKIKDKIDLLGEDSYAKRTQGIAAWRQSGVFALYLEMMAEALEGLPMEEVIAGREAAKKPHLSKEEIDAIVRLGVELRA